MTFVESIKRASVIARNNQIPELTELLQVAGHRPSKNTNKWICANCPAGKTPAMKVNGEVWYCHRCQRGGNALTLSRDLGEKPSRPQLSLEQRRVRRCARVLGYLVQQWEKSHRRWLSVQLRNAMDREIAARERGLALLSAGLAVDAETIDEAFRASQEANWYTLWLNSFDRLSPAELVAEYQHFQRSLRENGF